MSAGGSVNKGDVQGSRANWVESRNISEMDQSGIRDWLDMRGKEEATY